MVRSALHAISVQQIAELPPDFDGEMRRGQSIHTRPISDLRLESDQSKAACTVRRDIVNVAARKMPGVSFVFIGPERNAREKVAPAANVFLLGSRSYKQIPKYMSNADIGIIPFDFNKYPALVNSIHPLKLYEYMACGLPVIAARWRELELMDSPARLYSNEIEFIAAIDETIQNLPHLDKAGFVDYASKHDWRSKVKELIEKVGIKS